MNHEDYRCLCVENKYIMLLKLIEKIDHSEV